MAAYNLTDFLKINISIIFNRDQQLKPYSYFSINYFTADKFNFNTVCLLVKILVFLRAQSKLLKNVYLFVANI